MSKQLFDALVALDVAIKPEAESHIRGQALHKQQWLDEDADIDFALCCEVFYLSCDNGYSRLVWSRVLNEVVLTSNSIEPTRSRFALCVTEREAVNTIVRKILADAA